MSWHLNDSNGTICTSGRGQIRYLQCKFGRVFSCALYQLADQAGFVADRSLAWPASLTGQAQGLWGAALPLPQQPLP